MGSKPREIVRKLDNLAYRTAQQMGTTNRVQDFVHYIKDKALKYVVHPFLNMKQNRVISKFITSKLNLPRVGEFVDQKLGFGKKKRKYTKKTKINKTDKPKRTYKKRVSKKK
jgi:hypothetical protein